MRAKMRSQLFLAVALLTLSACSAYTRHLERGDEYARGRQWQLAKSEYEQAHAKAPERPEAPAKITALKETWAAEFTAQADGARGEKRFGEAISLYQRAIQVDPGNPTATAHLNETLDEWVKAARVLLSNRDHPGAIGQLDALLKLVPHHQGAYSTREEGRFALANQSFQLAEQFERQKKYGNALIEFLRADQARVGATPARERAEGVRKKLVDSIAYYAVINPVNDRANSPDVAQRFTTGRLGAMGQKLPIRFVTTAPANMPPGVKVTLTLDRLLFTKDRETSQRVQRYVATTKSVPNPKRGEAEKSLLSAERKIEETEEEAQRAMRTFLDSSADLERVRATFERCRSDVLTKCQKEIAECKDAMGTTKGPYLPGPCKAITCDSSGCVADDQAVAKQKEKALAALSKVEASSLAETRGRRDIQRLRDTVFREPLTVEQPLEADFYFDVDLNRATVRASVTLQIDPLAGDAPPAPITHDYVVVHEDYTHKGYDKYGIIADPLQLKSEMELRLAVGDAALVDIFQRVKARFETYRQTLLTDARRSLVRPAAEDAVEASVRAILASPDAPPQDLLTALSRARGISKPEGILAL
ncbi:MAG: outer membrane exchange accessory lipoprotein TraC [Myxococcaceae bacterium]